MECEHRGFLIFDPVRRHFTTFAKEDEPIGAIPVLDDVQPLMNFTAEGFGPEIVAKKDRLDHLAEFSERLVGRMLKSCAGEPPQNGFRICCAMPQCRRV